MSNYPFLILALVISFCCSVSAQNELDSLLTADELSTELEADSSIFYRRNRIMNHYISRGKFQNASIYFNDLENLALKLGLKYEAIYYSNLVTYYGMQNELDSAGLMLKKAIVVNKRIDDKDVLSMCYFNLGNVMMLKNNLDSSAILFFQALNYFEDNKEKTKQITVFNSLGSLFLKIGDQKKASIYGMKSIKMAQELKDTSLLAAAYTNYAKTLRSIEPVKFDTILSYQKEALKLYESQDNILGIARENSNIGSILWKMGDFENAPPYLKKAEQLYTDMGKERMLTITYLSLGSYHFKLKEYKKSKEYYEKALPLSKLKDDPVMLSHNYVCLARVDQKLDDLKSSIENYELAQSLNDSIDVHENRKIAFDLEKKYQNRIMADSISILTLESEKKSIDIAKRNNGLLSGAVIILLLGAFASIYRKYYRNQKVLNEILEKEKEELIFEKMELAKLNMLLESKLIVNSKKKSVNVIANQVKIKSADKVYLLESDQVRYVQAESDGIRVYYDDTSKWTDMSLKEFSSLLPENTFVQIFRSTIVNINHIGWVNTTSLKMKDGTELKISRTYKQKIKDAVIGNS